MAYSTAMVSLGECSERVVRPARWNVIVLGLGVMHFSSYSLISGEYMLC